MSDFLFKRRQSGLFVPAGLAMDQIQSVFGEQGDTSLEFDIPALRGVGIMPTYQDLWDEPSQPLIDLFQSVPIQVWGFVVSCLGSVLAHDIGRPESERTLHLRTIFLERQQVRIDAFMRDAPNAVLLAPFPVLLTMELAAVSSPPEASGGTIEPEIVDRVLQAFYLAWEQVNRPLHAEIEKNPAGVAAAMTERSELGSLSELTARAFGCWLWGHRYVGERELQARRYFATVMRREYSVELEDWVVGCSLPTFLVQCRTLHELMAGPLDLRFPAPNLTSVANALLHRVLNCLSTSFGAFAAFCRQCDKRAPLVEKPSLLPVKKHPCVQLGGDRERFWVISPVHLAEAAFERPVRLAETLALKQTDGHGTRFCRGEFGVVVEAYVHGLLHQMFPDRYERLNPRDDAIRADGVLWSPKGVVVVECKASRVAESMRYSVRTDEDYYWELVKSGLEKAVNQVDRTIDDVLSETISGKIPGPPRVAGSIIVCYQEVPRSGIGRTVLDRVLPETRRRGRVLQLRPQVVSLSDLETLDGWSHVELLEALHRKMLDQRYSLESLPNYLFFTYGRARRFNVRHMLHRLLIDAIRPWYNE